MDRRNTLLTLAALCTAARGAVAQQAGRTPRIGILGVGSLELMRQSLLELGWVDGQNVIIEARDLGGQVERFDAFAAELVRLQSMSSSRRFRQRPSPRSARRRRYRSC